MHPLNFSRLLLGYLVNRNLLAVSAQTLEPNHAVNASVDGVVAADAHALAGVDMGTSLANQDVASLNLLTVSALYAQTLRLRVTAVLSGAAALMVSEELNTNLKLELHLQNR